MFGFKGKQILKFICFLIPIPVLVFWLLSAHFSISFPSVTDLVRSLPIVHRVAPVHNRVSLHFSQEILYREDFLHDFNVVGETIISVTGDPQMHVYTNPEYTGRVLKIDISDLSYGETSAQVFYAFSGEFFSEDNSVRLVLENGLNIIHLPHAGYTRLRLDLAEARGISMVVNGVTVANYISLPTSLLVSFFVIVTIFVVLLFFWIFKREVLIRYCSRLKETLRLHSKVSYTSEKRRYSIAAVFVALIMSLTYLFVPIRFGTVDDVTMMYIVSGNFTGSPSPYLFWSNILFGYLLSGLYTLLPAVPWYGIVYIAFIFFAQMMIAKSFLKIAAQKQISIFVPLGLYTILYMFGLFYWTAVIQFTTTPAMMGAAACVVIASLYCGESKKARIWDIVSIILLIFFAYIIRRRSAMGTLPFAGVVAAYKVAAYLISKDDVKSKLRRVGVYVIVAISIAVSLFAVREINNQMRFTDGRIEFSRWNSQVSRFMNFPHVSYDENPELYASIGWDRDLYLITRNWNHLDERVTIENLRTINEYSLLYLEQQSHFERFENATYLAEEFIRDSDVAESSTRVIVVGFLILILVLGLRIKKEWMAAKCSGDVSQRNEYILRLLFSLAILGGFLASLIWLGWGERINLRAFFVPVMPAICILVWDVLYTWKPLKLTDGKMFFAGVAIASLFIYFYQIPFSTASDEAHSSSLAAGMERRLISEQYAIENPDSVFLFCGSVSGAVVPVFTTYSEERPFNLITSSGGRSRSDAGPVAMATVTAVGMDDFISSSLLQSGVYYITRSTDNIQRNRFINYMKNRYNARAVIIDYFDGIDVVKFIREG